QGHLPYMLPALADGEFATVDLYGDTACQNEKHVIVVCSLRDQHTALREGDEFYLLHQCLDNGCVIGHTLLLEQSLPLSPPSVFALKPFDHWCLHASASDGHSCLVRSFY